MTRIQPRPVPQQAFARLADAGLHPLLARLYVARGISRADELDTSLKNLLPPEALTGPASLKLRHPHEHGPSPTRRRPPCIHVPDRARPARPSRPPSRTRSVARRTLGLPGRLHFVNVSTALLAAPERLTHLAAAAEGCGTPWPQDDPRWRSLVIEITERELITDHSGVIRALAPLLEAGVRLALDDFGSGFSSFLYLADLPITFLKIEQALIARVGQDRRINIMVGALARMAADLNIITIAEGIESAATAASVAALGISWGQGYHFGRPGWE